MNNYQDFVSRHLPPSPSQKPELPPAEAYADHCPNGNNQWAKLAQMRAYVKAGLGKPVIGERVIPVGELYQREDTPACSSIIDPQRELDFVKFDGLRPAAAFSIRQAARAAITTPDLPTVTGEWTWEQAEVPDMLKPYSPKRTTDRHPPQLPEWPRLTCCCVQDTDDQEELFM